MVSRPFGVLLGLLVGVHLALAAPADAQSREPVGRVSSLTGAATVVRDGTPSALHQGARIHVADRVRTLADAKLRIRFRDGATLVMGANSVVAVDAYAAGDRGRGLLDMLEGIVRVVIQKASAWQSFEVETFNAVASVRSTEWIVVAEPDRSSVFVVEGAVAVTAEGRERRLAAGDGTDVPRGQPPGPVQQWGQSRVDAVLDRTTIR